MESPIHKTKTGKKIKAHFEIRTRVKSVRMCSGLEATVLQTFTQLGASKHQKMYF